MLCPIRKQTLYHVLGSQPATINNAYRSVEEFCDCEEEKCMAWNSKQYCNYLNPNGNDINHEEYRSNISRRVLE